MKDLCLISSDLSVPVVLCQHFSAFLWLGGLVRLLPRINLSGRYTSIHTVQQENEGRIIISVGHLDIYLPQGSVSFLGEAAAMNPVWLLFLFWSGYYGVSLRRSRACQLPEETKRHNPIADHHNMNTLVRDFK